jgi:hypothetical protein
MDEGSQKRLDQLDKEKKSKTKDFVRAINPKFLIIMVAIILLGMYAVNQKWFTTKQMTLIAISAVVIILILAYQEMSKSEYLTYDEAAAIAEFHLEQRQKYMRDIPQGEIKAIYAGKLQKVFGEPSLWSLGYEVRDYSDYTHTFEILIDPKVNGLGIIGVIPKTSGYDPTARKDVYPTTQVETDMQQGNMPQQPM